MNSLVLSTLQIRNALQFSTVLQGGSCSTENLQIEGI